ncbi:MAG: lysylphosphatidylglycerol synthase transmembrane domain-containing protein [Deltaproteobacteria bacterium]|jgi:uncharacterized protein (TIRG00374 family)|nr:lysylphosphatidylglycerol synthase transmembrane domain-containing protein [Deltaproteobacteria bacterium]
MKKQTKLLIKFLASFLLVFYLAAEVDWGELTRSFVNVNIIDYVISAGFAVVVSCTLAQKYYVLLKGSNINKTFSSLLKINFISRFYALFLPSAVGREAVRWLKVTKNKTGRSFFFFTIVYERMTSFIVILLFGILPLYSQSIYPEAVETLKVKLLPLLITMIFAALSFLILYISMDLRVKLKSILEKIFPVNIIEKLFNKVPEGHITVDTFFLIILFSVLGQLFFITRMFFLFKALALPLSIIEAAWIASVTLLLQILPISFAGLGIREGALAYIFLLLGLSPEKGIVVGGLFFSQMVLLASFGAVLNYFDE